MMLLVWGLMYVFGGHIIGFFYPWEYGTAPWEYELISGVVFFAGLGVVGQDIGGGDFIHCDNLSVCLFTADVHI